MTQSESLTELANRVGDYCIGSDRWSGLSKLIEECGEVQQVGGKIIGNEGRADHWDGSHLPTRMAEELGDLLGAIDFLVAHNDLDDAAIQMRRARKRVMFDTWHHETAALRARGSERP